MINLLILILLFQVTVKNLTIYQNQYYDTYRLIKAKKKNIFKLYLFIIPLLIIDLIYNYYIFSLASITFLILLYTGDDTLWQRNSSRRRVSDCWI